MGKHIRRHGELERRDVDAAGYAPLATAKIYAGEMRARQPRVPGLIGKHEGQTSDANGPARPVAAKAI